MLALGLLGFTNLPATLAQGLESELELQDMAENGETEVTIPNEEAVIPPSEEEAAIADTENGNVVIDVEAEAEIVLDGEEGAVDDDEEAGEGSTTPPPTDDDNTDVIVVTETPFLAPNSGNVLTTAGTIAVGLVGLLLM